MCDVTSPHRYKLSEPNCTAASRTHHLSVNHVLVNSSLVFCGTNDHWRELPVRVRLLSGMNVVTLKTAGGGGVVLDSLRITHLSGGLLLARHTPHHTSHRTSHITPHHTTHHRTRTPSHTTISMRTNRMRTNRPVPTPRVEVL
jgi:hypothetical protein